MGASWSWKKRGNKKVERVGSIEEGKRNDWMAEQDYKS